MSTCVSEHWTGNAPSGVQSRQPKKEKAGPKAGFPKLSTHRVSD